MNVYACKYCSLALFSEYKSISKKGERTYYHVSMRKAENCCIVGNVLAFCENCNNVVGKIVPNNGVPNEILFKHVRLIKCKVSALFKFI